MSMDIGDNSKVVAGYSNGSKTVGSETVVGKSNIKDTNKTDEKDNEMGNAKKGVAHSSMEDAVSRANNALSKTHCEFSYNDAVNRVSITVIDDNTGDVVREIPPEESLKMLEKMWEITGLMVDEKR